MQKKIIVALLIASVISLLIMNFGAPATLAEEPTASPTAAALSRLFEIKPEQVERLLISADGKSVSFARQRDGFSADSPSYKPYEKSVAATLQHLADLQGTTVSMGGSDIAQWGLDDPTVTVMLFVAATESRPLKVGKFVTDTVTPKTHYYASTWPARAEVFAIPAAIVDELKSYLTTPSSPAATATTIIAPTTTPTIITTATPTIALPTKTVTATITAVATVAVSATPTIVQQPTSTQTVQPTASPTIYVPPKVEPTIPTNLAPLFIVGGGLVVMLLALVLVFLLFKNRGRGSGPETTPLPEPPPSSGPFLEGITEPRLRFDLVNNVMTLGRASDCDLLIPGDVSGAASISRHHARFENRAGRWAVVDGIHDGTLSTNGITVDGKRTLENYLLDNDEIGLGDMLFRFRMQPAATNPAEGGQ